MKNLFIGLIIIYTSFLFQVSFAQTVSIIPKPSDMTIGKGVFNIDTSTVIWVESDSYEINAIAEMLQTRINEAYGLWLPIVTFPHHQKKFIAFVKKESSDSEEAYKMEVAERSIYISANASNGLFYGLQSLLQLMPTDVYGKSARGFQSINIPQLTIADEPRFAYRGMHLDVGRHFYPKEDIIKFIDYLALHKFNRFQWHLTEDQGWRIEIKKYPKLTEVGAWRKETVVGTARKEESLISFDGKKYGGYYTQEEIKEVVAYAQKKKITIIPEIEFPGHMVAALTAYPQFACTPGPFEVRTTWGVSKDVLCPNNSSLTFAKNILKEVMALFPSEYIHIGGDECPKDRWKECVTCQKMIKDKKLKDENGLQAYFIHQLEEFLNVNGRKLIGWDEITEGGLSKTSTVTYWRSWGEMKKLPLEIAKHGNNIIMSPVSNNYFDYYQSLEPGEPLAWGGELPVAKVYNFEPVPQDFTAELEPRIIGTQANIWTEYMPTFEQVEYMSLPRMSALAEVAWTKKENKNYMDFVARMKLHFQRLDFMGANYARHLLIEK